MQVYEYNAEVLKDGHLSIPDEVIPKLKSLTKVKVMLIFNDEESSWDDLAMSQFVVGYSDKDAIYDKL